MGAWDGCAPPRQVAHQMLRGLRLAGTTLARHDQRGWCLVALDKLVRSLAHRVHMRVDPLRPNLLVHILGEYALACAAHKHPHLSRPGPRARSVRCRLRATQAATACTHAGLSRRRRRWRRHCVTRRNPAARVAHMPAVRLERGRERGRGGGCGAHRRFAAARRG